MSFSADPLEMDYYDENSVQSISKLSQGIVLKDLLQSGEAHFTLTAGNDEEEPTNVEDAYNFSEYEHLVNLDCLGIGDGLPFEALSEKMTNVTEDGGVKKFIKEKGSAVKVPEKAVVYVHYNMFLEFQEVPFDSSSLRSMKPAKYQLGVGALFPGMDIAISSMCVDEKSYFMVDSKYAFKEIGVPPRIPGSATILIDLHLIKYIDCGAILGDNDNEENVLSKKSFVVNKKKALSYMNIAKDCFSKKNYNSAADGYRKAVYFLSTCELANDDEECMYKKLLMKSYTNLTVCYNFTHQYKRVISVARDAMSLDPTAGQSNSKFQFQWGKAFMYLKEYQEAFRHLKIAKSIEPNNLEIDKLLREVESLRKSYNQDEKIMFSKALGINKLSLDCEDKKNNEILYDEAWFEKIKEELKQFAKSKISRFSLPEGLSHSEITAIRKICEELNLAFQEIKIGDDVKINIVK